MTTQIKYEKDDVWVLEDTGGFNIFHETTILSIRGGFIKTNREGWLTSASFHKRAKAKVGRVRRFCGIPFGIKR